MGGHPSGDFERSEELPDVNNLHGGYRDGYFRKDRQTDRQKHPVAGYILGATMAFAEHNASSSCGVGMAR